jgi:RNA polymerase sigma-70 factor (ECF subfamily)
VDDSAGTRAVEAAPPDVDRDTESGFTAWVSPHWSAMARLAAGLTGSSGWEDVLQDALVAAWRARRRFDPARGSARAWLLAITADKAAKARRSSRRHPHLLLADDPPAPTLPARDLDIERALSRLTDRQRLAIQLFYYLGSPVAEIAVVMSCSAGTVKSTLADARARLRDELGGES